MSALRRRSSAASSPPMPMPRMTKEEQAAYDEAQKRIEKCRRDKGTSLDLGYLKLSALPPEIGQLTALAALHLHDNQLTTLPPEIGQLTALTALHLHDNQLTT